jgi:MFS family permease
MGSKPREATRTTSHLPRNIWVLAWVAFFNDTATEMSYWLLPQFLVDVLGAGPTVFGLIEGFAETISSFGRLLSGYLSDRLRQRKILVGAGYTVANVVKPLLALAQSWRQVFWIRFADRAAKGFRAAPRDALIADSVPQALRGSAFGLRQAMDSAGAILGPLGAIVFLPLFAGNVRSVFWMATIPGAICIFLAWSAIREVPPSAIPGVGGQPRLMSTIRQAPGGLTMILAGVALFSLGNSSDLFLILRAQNLGIAGSRAPALGLIFNAVYTLLSWPAGRVSDRVPRRAIVIIGYLIYAGVYLGFALVHTARLTWLLFAVYGVYYALTEGVLRAWVADLVPSASRASVFGILNWVVGMAALPASLLAGWLWQHYSPATPFFASCGLSLAAAAFLWFA